MEEKKVMKEEKSREEMAEARRQAVEQRRAKLQSMKKSEAMATHMVKEGETLSHIALKYYKHATPPIGSSCSRKTKICSRAMSETCALGWR